MSEHKLPQHDYLWDGAGPVDALVRAVAPAWSPAATVEAVAW